MPKGISEMNYIHAIQIMYGEWGSINHCDCEDIDGEYVLPAKSISAETKLIKKQTWENLSAEAKELILVIISAPDELLEIFKTPERGIFSKRRIKKHFKRIWFSKFITETTIKEITKWVNQL